jgi:hypothetical protein
MSRNQGAIPKLILFITPILLGILFNVPDEVNIGVMILKAFQPTVQSMGNEMATRMLEQQIFFLHIFGWALIIVEILVIVILFRRRQYV